LAATVLVADDDADIVRFVEIYLRLEGFEVVTARDGPDVLANAVAVRPDLVLLDVLMPGLGPREPLPPDRDGRSTAGPVAPVPAQITA
jgi:DNA-binding response OmpR family regulator